jgi:peptidoglycan/LPS O-acetylase OafA/YrhL
MAPVREFRALTGLRIVAALWVVVFHFHFTPLPDIARVSSWFGPLITQGALGVDLFFVISGFVIAHTYLDRLGPALRVGATARFVWARASRMWPVYVLVFNLFGLWLVARLVFGGGGIIAYQSVQPVVSIGQWAQQMLMVQMWNNAYLDGASWVGPTWSLSAEWLAYMLFPVAALVFFRLRNLPVVVLGAGSLALMTPIAWAYVSIGSPYYPWSWAVRVLCGFGAGVLAYLVVRRMRSTGRSPEKVLRRASVLAAATPLAIVAGLVVGELAGPGRGGAVLVLFPVLVGALALADRGPATVLARPWMVWGGRISFSLYLVHIPIFEVYWTMLDHFHMAQRHAVIAYLAGLVALLAAPVLAWLAFRIVEEPARLRMRRMHLPQRRGCAVPQQLGDPMACAPTRPVPAAARLVAAIRNVHATRFVAPAPRRGGCHRLGGSNRPSALNAVPGAAHWSA